MKRTITAKLSLTISLIPYIFAVMVYNSIIHDPSAKYYRGHAIMVSKPEFMGLILVLGFLFYFLSGYLSHKVAAYLSHRVEDMMLPGYESNTRLMLVTAFAIMIVLLILSNMH